MWHSCQENSTASGAFTYLEVLVLWLEEGDGDLHWKSHGAGLGKGCHLSGPVCAVNKGTEGICENRSVDDRVK